MPKCQSVSVRLKNRAVSVNELMLVNEKSVKVCFCSVGSGKVSGAAVRGMMFGF